MSFNVALFTRAWIEIVKKIGKDFKTKVALFTRAWIEMLLLCYLLGGDYGRPLYEGVD